MTDKTPIRALIEAIERGEVRPYVIEEMASPIFHHSVWPNMGPAFNGSLDAAKALHEALLPGWLWDVWHSCSARVTNDADRNLAFYGSAPEATPARAWLLSILKAHEAQQ